jgi:hypothetical protein
MAGATGQALSPIPAAPPAQRRDLIGRTPEQLAGLLADLGEPEHSRPMRLR